MVMVNIKNGGATEQLTSQSSGQHWQYETGLKLKPAMHAQFYKVVTIT